MTVQSMVDWVKGNIDIAAGFKVTENMCLVARDLKGR